MAPGLFRLVLATFVVISHYTRLSLGWTAVYIFFVLSGYWVTQMWCERYSRCRRPYETFMISRAWRMLPVFVLCSILAMALAGNFQHILPSLLIFGYNWIEKPLLIQAWSLDIEMQFYLLAPAIILMIGRQPRTALALLLTTGAVSSALFAGLAVVSYLPYFVVGVAAAALGWLPNRTQAHLFAWTFVALFVLSVTLPPLRSMILLGGQPKPGSEYNGLLNIFFAILLVPYALYTVQQRSTRFDRLLGDLSYPVYLLHWLPVLALAIYWPELPQSGTLVRAPVVGAAIMGSYAVSLLMLLYIDRPLNVWRARFVDRRRLDEKTPDDSGVSNGQ
jgi:peptidoglycan/LPS O-acetylase OafA/YrhL